AVHTLLAGCDACKPVWSVCSVWLSPAGPRKIADGSGCRAAGGALARLPQRLPLDLAGGPQQLLRLSHGLPRLAVALVGEDAGQLGGLPRRRRAIAAPPIRVQVRGHTIEDPLETEYRRVVGAGDGAGGDDGMQRRELVRSDQRAVHDLFAS